MSITASRLEDLVGRNVFDVFPLSVRDTGAGIAAQFLPHVFERFARVRGRVRSRREGSARLSIVKHLAEAHGGEVRAASDGPGTGATFTVTLPLTKTVAAGR